MNDRIQHLTSRHFAICIFTMFSLFCFCQLGKGQTTSADLYGSVKDQTGAIVRGASVVVVNTLTNQAYAVKSDPEGVYHVRGLEPGNYKVSAEAEGFKKLEHKGISLDVGQSLDVDLALPIGAAAESVTVTGEGTQLETSSGQVSALVGKETLNELPLNGRDLFSLTLLQPGVVPTTNAHSQAWTMGNWSKGAVQGTRPSMFNVTSDGSDINDPGFNIPPGGPIGAQLGVEATEEYRIIVNPYNAENGRNGGAQVQYATKSGTNQFHGTAYEFVRNSALDARNYFDVAVIPHFSRNQFGASFGGPIVKDKLFFFANWESLHEIQGITDNSVVVPNLNTIAGLLPSKANPAVLVNVGVNPVAAKFLALYSQAVPNGTDLGNGTAYWNGSGLEKALENYGVIRVDYHLSGKDQIFERSAVDDGNLLSPFAATNVPGFPYLIPSLSSYNQLSWQRLIEPQLLNQLKLNFNMTNYVTQPATAVPNGSGQYLSTSLTPGDPYLGASGITGVANVGYAGTTPLGSFANNFEIIDNISWDRGHHTFKAGADLKHLQLAGPFSYGLNGLYTFSSLGLHSAAVSNNANLESFLKGQPYQYVGSNPNYDSNRFWRQNYTGFYVQDDWRIADRLTLNLGVRYDFSTNPSEKYNRQGNIMNYQTATALVNNSNQIFQSLPKDMFSPRIGFAWRPFGDKTSLRGGFGIMRDQIWENLYSNTRFYGPYYQIVQANSSGTNYVNYLLSPGNFAAIGGVQQNIGSFGITWTPKIPYYYEYSLDLERQVTNNMLLTLGYAGSHGVHLPRTGEQNPFVPSLNQRLNPNFGGVPLIVTDATSAYNAFEFSLKQRVTSGLMFQVSYTWSHNIDTASGPYTSDYTSAPGTTMNFFNLEADKGPSDIDRRDVLVANFVYDLPIGRGKRLLTNPNRIVQAAVGGWQWSGILSLETGPTYTVVDGSTLNTSGISDTATEADRPNMVNPGTSQCTNTGNPNAWFNTAIYALPAQNTYGNAGRNGGCGPALRDFDTNFTKSVHLSEHKVLQLRADLFNIFNITNFAEPTNTLYQSRVAGCNTGNACGVVSPSAGKITSTVTTSRQIQLAAKFMF